MMIKQKRSRFSRSDVPMGRSSRRTHLQKTLGRVSMLLELGRKLVVLKQLTGIQDWNSAMGCVGGLLSAID